MSTAPPYNEVAAEELQRDAGPDLSRPVLCREGTNIPGQSMPPANTEPSDLVDVVGADCLVTVLQYTEEREIILPFREWVLYLEDVVARENTDKTELNSVSFNVRKTPLSDLVRLPDFWLDLDLRHMVYGPEQQKTVEGSIGTSGVLLGYDGGAAHAAASWRMELTADFKFRSTIGVASQWKSEGAGGKIKVDPSKGSMSESSVNSDNKMAKSPVRPLETPLFCTMCTSGCYSDFFIPYGGSASYFYVASGAMWIYLVEPSTSNVQKFEQWVAAGNMKFQFFGGLVDRCDKMELEAGASAYIPPGWIIGTFYPEDSIIFGSNILMPLALPTHMDIYAMERRLMAPTRFRYPHFESLLFETINWIRSRVSSSNLEADLRISRLQASMYTSLLRTMLLWYREREYWQQYHSNTTLESEPDFPQTTIDSLKYLDALLQFSTSGSVEPNSNEAIFVRSWKMSVNNAADSAPGASALVQRPIPPMSSASASTSTNASTNTSTNTFAGASGAAASNLNFGAYAAQAGAGHPYSQGQDESRVPRAPARVIVAPLNGSNNNRVNEQLQCDKCLGYFSKKGLGPHRRYCKGELKKDYSLHRPKINIGADGNESIKVQSSTHRSSCHRCGNLRKKVVLCPRCPNIYCRKCSEKMREEHGQNVFETGCPFCKQLCCCQGERSRNCPRKYHCYKKCPVSLAPNSY